MRLFRTVIALFVLLLGITLALVGVLDTVNDTGVRILMVLCGVLLVEVSAWKRANPLLPNERRNEPLRTEVDHVIDVVRRLEHATRKAERTGDEADWTECARLHVELHQTVSRAAELTGSRRRRAGAEAEDDAEDARED